MTLLMSGLFGSQTMTRAEVSLAVVFMSVTKIKSMAPNVEALGLLTAATYSHLL
jgi:hypothetical protein